MNMKIKNGAFAYFPVSQLFTQKISSTGHLLRGFLLLLFALAWPLSIRPAQAGYIVTLQQVGPNVVATGSGAIDLTGLTVWGLSTRSPAIRPNQVALGGAFIYTGPISSSVDSYRGASGPTSFGSGFFFTSASSGSGDMVGIVNTVFGFGVGSILSVPTGYVSGTALSDMAIYSGNTLATLGVTPGTYVWTWGAGANQNFTLKILSAAQPTPNPFDFNGDGKTDYVLQNVSTRQTALWYLNNTFLGGAYGPTLPASWSLVDVGDFNGGGKPDYALFNPTTRQTAIWYMNNNALIGGAYGPTLPSGWSLVATGDFNNDSKPDYVLYNASTRQTALWYMHNNVFAGGVFGPTLPAGWRLVGVADFNGDGHTDYALFNPSTRQTAIWYLSGVTFVGGAYGPTLPSGWELVATGDFNGDGKPDYVLYKASTRQTAIWYMNNAVFVSAAYGPTLPVGWSLVAP